MINTEFYQEVFDCFILNEQVIFFNHSEFILQNVNNNLKIENLSQCRYLRYRNYLNLIQLGKIEVLDSSFDILFTIENELIRSDGSSIFYFDENNFFIENNFYDKLNRKLVTSCIITLKSKSVTQVGFFGKVLNENFRLNFASETISNPLTFRCSNLLDTETYWEFDCAEGEQVRGSFTVYGEKLLFYTFSEPTPYDYHYWVNVIDLRSGEVLFKIPSRHVNCHFDKDSGLFVTVSGTIMNQQDYKIYEIINVNTGEQEVGDVICDDTFVTVGAAMQYIYNNRLYFIDNFITIGGKKYCENPKIGCFDFIKKELIYFKEIPKFKKKTVAQLICNDNKIYIRTQHFELFVFEEEV
ncbi:hypothetical protein SAMN06298216_3391 [Spirosomataceae bacterium TFI 002]|nr:hypothetical protein SAMN06298216_3391 [Spirosomataceae bacterium TFI 002]